MCGIVGAVAKRNVVPILLDGLKQLEYRGYDSAGIATINRKKNIQLVKRQGKVNILSEDVGDSGIYGHAGIAHTRWATHGKPCEHNAHPHQIKNRIMLVHNGIVENYLQIQRKLNLNDYSLSSKTDSEIIAAAIYEEVNAGHSLLIAVQRIVNRLHGTYAIAVMDLKTPNCMVAARYGSPLVIGLIHFQIPSGSRRLKVRFMPCPPFLLPLYSGQS